MANDDPGAVLVVSVRPLRRWEVAFWVGFTALFGGVLAVAVGTIVVREWRANPGAALSAVAAGVALVGLFGLTAVLAERATPRGTWTIDGEGVTFRPTRGPARAVRWAEVDRVRWGAAVAFRGDGGRLLLPLHLVDEPARARARERLAALLGKDFDLSTRRTPDPLDGVEPAWWNFTLRAARVLAVSLGWTAALLGSLWWAATRFPERGAWQGQALFAGWYVFLMTFLLLRLCTELRRNPTWRRRLVKGPVDDLWEAH